MLHLRIATPLSSFCKGPWHSHVSLVEHPMMDKWLWCRCAAFLLCITSFQHCCSSSFLASLLCFLCWPPCWHTCVAAPGPLHRGCLPVLLLLACQELPAPFTSAACPAREGIRGCQQKNHLRCQCAQGEMKTVPGGDGSASAFTRPSPLVFWTKVPFLWALASAVLSLPAQVVVVGRLGHGLMLGEGVIIAAATGTAEMELLVFPATSCFWR